MANLGDGRKLTGNDGAIYKATIGAEVNGNGVAVLNGYYLVTAVHTATGFPANTTGDDITAGRVIKAITADDIKPVAGDKTKLLTLTQMCDINSFTLPFTSDEIDVSTFCDDIKTYERGKTDLQGSMSGIVTIDDTTGDGQLLNQFIDVVVQNHATSYDVYEATQDVYFALFKINKTTTKGDEIAIFMPINVFSASVGGGLGEAQAFQASFRLASYEGILPALYRWSL